MLENQQENQGNARQRFQQVPPDQGLYSFLNEHDACGVGLVASLDNKSSHDIVEMGITVLKRLMHRGASGCDPETGDGAGMLCAIPDAFFRKSLPVPLPKPGKYAVMMLFGGEHEESVLESLVTSEGGRILYWRNVPVNPDAIGKTARQSCPLIRQVFIGGQDFPDQAAFERKLFVMRRLIEKRLPSLSLIHI